MRRLILIVACVLVLAAALAACGGSAGGGSSSAATTAPAATASATGAAAIWDQQCAGCHAADPAGVGVTDVKTVQRVVEDGVQGMPAFKGKLSAADIKAVSEYVAKASQ